MAVPYHGFSYTCRFRTCAVGQLHPAVRPYSRGGLRGAPRPGEPGCCGPHGGLLRMLQLSLQLDRFFKVGCMGYSVLHIREWYHDSWRARRSSKKQNTAQDRNWDFKNLLLCNRAWTAVTVRVEMIILSCIMSYAAKDLFLLLPLASSCYA